MTPLLPNLKSSRLRRLEPTATGWSVTSLSELNELADSLESDPWSTHTDTVPVVPDIWARFLGYAISLNDRTHPSHAMAVASLRGLLAVLAMRVRKHIQVGVHRIDLDEGSRHPFLSTIARFKPSASMASDIGWDRLYIFRLDDTALGATSPLTLVCPNDGAHLTALRRIPWWDGRRLGDPRAYLGTQERHLLAAWIRKVKEELTGSQARFEGRYRETLAGLLTDFEFDLTRGLGAASEPLAVVEDMPELAYGLYGCLASAIQGESASVIRSKVMLRSVRRLGGRDSSSGLKELLVLDTGLDQKWGIDPTEIEIVSGHSQADLKVLALGSNRASLGSVLLPPRVEWRQDSDFFTNRLVFVKHSGDAFPGAVKIEGEHEVAVKYGATPILPVRQELLSYLTPEYLRDHCSYRVTGDSVECGVTLPLSGNDLRVTHTYKSEEIHTIEELPVVEVWPGFSSAVWHLYYTFWDVRGPLYLRPYTLNEQALTFIEVDDHGKTVREISELKSPPEFLLCYLRTGPSDSARDEEVGLIVPVMAKVPANREAEFHIGVDFGTTNTTVYMRRDGDIPRAMELRVTSHQVTASQPSERSESLYRYFFPGETERPPFLSFFRVRPGGWSGGSIQPVREGHIYFFNEKYNWDELLAGTDVSTRLKWERDRKPLVRAYLQQLCVQCAAEAALQGAGSISWHYSVPTAFPEFLVAEFSNIWIWIRKWVSTVVDVRCEEAVRQTESVAVARYFAAIEGPGKAFPAVGALFIDIGGGTSDISIWQDRRLLLQSSIRLSGREMFLRPLFQMRHQVLPLLKREIIDDSSRARLLSLSAEDKFSAATDALLRTKGEEIRRWLAIAPDDADLKRFIGRVALSLCGLFYYAGMMLRHVEERSKDAYRSSDLPSIHLCGNGSRVIHWVTSGSYNPQMPIARLLKIMLAAGAGREVARGEFRIEFSPQPKAEAAYGLVAEYLLGDVDLFEERAFQSVVAGEPFVVGSDARSEVGLEQLGDFRTGIEVYEIPSLRRFIDIYKQQSEQKEWALESITDAEEMLANALSAVKDWSLRQKNRERGEIELEPLFIVGLRELLSFFLEARQARKAWWASSGPSQGDLR